MQNRLFDAKTIPANIVPFLEIKDIPSFALINKSSGQFMHLLNTSNKFRESSGVSKAMFLSLQREAKEILNRTLSNYDEDNSKLKTALTDVTNGKMGNETLKALREQKIIYQRASTKPVLDLAGCIVMGSIGIVLWLGSKGIIRSRDELVVCMMIILAAVIAALAVLLVGGIGYGAITGLDRYRAKEDQKHLQQRIQFFQRMTDLSDEKEAHDKKTCAIIAKL